MTRPIASGDVLDGSEYARLVAERTSEADFQAQVEFLARSLGYLVFHARQARHSEPGWPDLYLVGHGRRIAAELKTARSRIDTTHRVTSSGRVLPCQACWLRTLRAGPGETYLLRPMDVDLLLDLLSPVETAARLAAVMVLDEQTRIELERAECRPPQTDRLQGWGGL